MLEGTDWKGPDADKFRSEWNGQHVAMLAKVSQALQEAGEQASRNATEQESASRWSEITALARTHEASGPRLFNAAGPALNPDRTMSAI